MNGGKKSFDSSLLIAVFTFLPAVLQNNWLYFPIQFQATQKRK
jgi:hypothetical protein